MHTYTHTHISTNSYVVRRILRRGIRYCTEKLGAKPGVFSSLVYPVVDILVSCHVIPVVILSILSQVNRL